MASFKYKVESKKLRDDFDRHSIKEDEYIEKNANDGWELISVVSESPNLTWAGTTYYWKKPIQSY